MNVEAKLNVMGSIGLPNSVQGLAHRHMMIIKIHVS